MGRGKKSGHCCSVLLCRAVGWERRRSRAGRCRQTLPGCWGGCSRRAGSVCIWRVRNRVERWQGIKAVMS